VTVRGFRGCVDILRPVGAASPDQQNERSHRSGIQLNERSVRRLHTVLAVIGGGSSLNLSNNGFGDDSAMAAVKMRPYGGGTDMVSVHRRGKAGNQNK
jgi:hypothetical protein